MSQRAHLHTGGSQIAGQRTNSYSKSSSSATTSTSSVNNVKGSGKSKGSGPSNKKGMTTSASDRSDCAEDSGVNNCARRFPG